MKYTMPISIVAILIFMTHNTLAIVLGIIAILLATIGMMEVVKDESKRIF